MITHPNISSVQLLSHIQLFVTPGTAACQASLSITDSWSLFKFMSIDLVIPSNHLILCHLLFLLPSLFASIFPNLSQLFQELAPCIRQPMYWSFSFSVSPSNKYSELISFRIDWFDLVVQGTFKSLFSTIHKHQFFGIEPSLWSTSHFRT